MVAKIPFAFHANQNSFAAGEYSVDPVGTNGIFQLRSREDGHGIFVNAPPTVESRDYAEGHLTFACYQGDCVLSQIWLTGEKVGYARSESSVDRDLQRKLGMATMISVRLTAH
jgi:hypothetical protein